MQTSRRHFLFLLSAIFVALSGQGSAVPAHASTATITTLQVSSACIAEGCVTTLTATVAAAGTPVHPGLVFFCDGAAAGCEYGLPLGQAQSTANGTATIERTLSPGVHHLHAIFHGTSIYGGSVSVSHDLTIAPKPSPATTTALSTSGSYTGYELSGFVTGQGVSSPTGPVSFLDASNQNALVSTAALGPGATRLAYDARGLDLSKIPASLLTSATAAAAGDFNIDGFQDAVTVSTTGVQVLFGDGKGHFSLAPSTTNSVGSQPTQVLVADFNSDGKLDIAVPDSSGDRIYVSLGNGDGTFTDAKPTTLPNRPQTLYLGDFNNDGVPDLVAYSIVVPGNPYSKYGLQPLLGKGDGTFMPTATTYFSSNGLSPSVVVADYDRDGNQDIAVQDVSAASASLGQYAVSVLHGNGDGSFKTLPHPVAADPSLLVGGDFNQDGISDLIALPASGGNAAYLQGNGDGTFTQIFVYNTLFVDASTPGSVITGDFNGDGVLDLASVRTSNSYTPPLYYFEADLGGYTPAAGYDFTYGNSDAFLASANVVMVVADFNSDGIPDLLSFNPNGPSSPEVVPTSSTYIGQNRTTAMATSGVVTLPGAGVHNIVASYTGDGGHDPSVSAPTALNGIQVVAYPGGFSDPTGITLNGGASLQGKTVRLTDGHPFESRSFFASSRVPVYLFNTTFDFQITNPEADGFAFVLEANGPNAIGSGGAALGYGLPPGATSGASIVNSVALLFDLHNNQGEGSNSVRIATGGNVTPSTAVYSAIDLTPSGLDLHSGHRFQAQISGSYNNLSLTLTDLTTKKVAQGYFAVDLFGTLGDTVAYVGFTAGTGMHTATVDILDWTYSAEACCNFVQPSPVPSFTNGFANASGALQLNRGAVIAGSALQLTGNTPFEATSAYFPTKLNTAGWSTDFDFKIEGTGGDGFTFLLQNQGLTATGTSGGALGYGSYSPSEQTYGIHDSLAIKFDLHNNGGEGPNSTGSYVNGVYPSVPATDLYTSHIDLHSGHTFHARIYYGPRGPNVAMTDLDAYAVSTSKIGGLTPSPNAFAGFTAGTGATSNTIKILNWTWTYYDPPR